MFFVDVSRIRFFSRVQIIDDDDDIKDNRPMLVCNPFVDWYLFTWKQMLEFII